MSTGTHGSALDVGAVQDYVVGLHLVLAPDRHLWIERKSYPVTVDGFADTVATVRALRDGAGLPWEGYDVVIEADSSGEFVELEPNEPTAWQEAGATWWVESWWTLDRDEAGLSELRRRIEAGPPS